MSSLSTKRTGTFFEPTPQGNRLRTILLPVVLVVVVFAIVLAFILRSPKHTDGVATRNAATLYALYAQYGLTEPDKKITFDSSPGTVTKGVALMKDGRQVRCTITTGDTAQQVTARCQ